MSSLQKWTCETLRLSSQEKWQHDLFQQSPKTDFFFFYADKVTKPFSSCGNYDSIWSNGGSSMTLLKSDKSAGAEGRAGWVAQVNIGLLTWIVENTHKEHCAADMENRWEKAEEIQTIFGPWIWTASVG